MEKQKAKNPAFEYQSYLALMYFDCAEKTMADAQNVFYSDFSRKGEIVHTVSWKRDKLEYDDFVPGSFGATMLRTVCAWKL